MPRRAKIPVLVARVLAGLLLVAIALLIATFGGFLNHCRGGYVHFGPHGKEGTLVYNEWYWVQHILARLLFALPTGIVVVSSALFTNKIKPQHILRVLKYNVLDSC